MPVSKQPARIKPTRKAAPVSPEDVKEMIAETAYYLAEHRGFQGECQLHDWLEAESKIERIYGKVLSKQSC
ncbi:MAG: hypothetical protein CO187_08440 [Zetaproteobacteria bacterium CG_4_9_14_3_um_filter_53_7]|nr:MAG: hypothetical protein CO187_08440 [Zetaproteobacteria bacterium CG_4_9_14_3_um_filter_53_7]